MNNESKLHNTNSTTRMRLSIRRRLSFIFLSILFLIFIIFIVGEVLIRCFQAPLPGIQTCIEAVDDDRSYALRPNTEWQFNGLYEKLKPPVTWQVNGQGVRDNKLIEEVNSNPQKIRIAQKAGISSLYTQEKKGSKSTSGSCCKK